MPTGRSSSEIKRLRRAVYTRDGFTCQDCGTVFRRPKGWKGEKIEGLTLGHIYPKAHGGAWAITNLIAQCTQDNADLGDRIWVYGWREIYAAQEAERDGVVG